MNKCCFVQFGKFAGEVGKLGFSFLQPLYTDDEREGMLLRDLQLNEAEGQRETSRTTGS